MGNVILIAGTYHGGWYWSPIVPALEQAGHRVFAPTLTGLSAEGVSEVSVNLDTHIEDVVRIAEDNQLNDVVLVGWSYGGMVVTGALDRLEGRVKKAIYLDAQVPNPGEREWDLIPVHEHEMFIELCKDGINLYPDDGMLSYEPRMHPHPFATKLQPVRYDQANFDSVAKVFVFAEKWFHDPAVESPIKKSYLRAQSGKGWTTQSWPNGHDLLREDVSRVLDLLLQELAS